MKLILLAVDENSTQNEMDQIRDELEYIIKTNMKVLISNKLRSSMVVDLE